MATAVTHIVFAEKLYEKYFSRLDPAAFFFGVNFPDIRMTTNKHRQETHLPINSLTEIIDTTDSLQAGSKFHCLTDLARTEFYQPRDSYLEKYFAEPHFGAALKFLEDEYCYNLSQNWADYTNYNRHPSGFNPPTGYNREQIQHYGQITADYIQQIPNPISRQQYIQNMGFSLADTQNNERTMDKLRQDPRVQQYISELFGSINEIIK